MRPILPRFLAGALACCSLPGAAAAELLTPISFQAALAAAETYAADRTLVFYCLRHNIELAPFTYFIVHAELQDALVKLRGAGSSAQQNAELVQAVLANVRFPVPGADDPALETECRARDVEKSYYRFEGSFSMPLAMRRPFKDLTAY